MASVVKRGQKFYVKWKGADGRRRFEVSSAQTKTEAKRLALELEQKAERQRLGLEEMPPTDGGGTLAELLQWWLDTYSKGSPAHATNVSAITCHLLPSDLARLPLVLVTPGKIESFLQAKASELGPQSLNHLRGFISRAFSTARKVERYMGPNPAAEVEKRKVPRRVPDFLRPEEVPPLLRALAPRWRPLFAGAIYTALRKGELAGLRKPAVDLRRGMLTVERSYRRDTTKGGHADVIPIASELIPYLEAAIAASPSDLVFPKSDGSMMRKDTDLEGVLRRAMARAGLVTGYSHVCRKRGCGHVEEAPDAALRRCPKHGAKLWPKGKVRPIRFHDLRHTTASLLMMNGVNPAAVQRILRHSDPKITTEVYGHLTPNYLRAEIDRLSFGAPPPLPAAQVEEVRAVANSSSLGATVVQASANENERAGTLGISPVIPAPSTARDTGFEPVAFGSGGPRPSGTSSHPIVSPGDFDADGGLNQHQIAGFPLSFLTPVLQDRPSAWPLQELAAHLWLSTGDLERLTSGILSDCHLPQPQPVEDELLTVEEVARRLRVSRATAYSLCRRGDLVHVRVGKSIRVRPEVLAAFISGVPPGGAQPLLRGATAADGHAAAAPDGSNASPEQIGVRKQPPARRAARHRRQRA